MPVRVAVVILNWNGWQDTLGLLKSIRLVQYEPLTVVVIDNDSTDDSVPRIEAWLRESGARYRVMDWDPARREASVSTQGSNGDRGQEFVLIRSPENLGFCAGNNSGMLWAFANGADYVLVLNNDTVVNPDFLAPMVQVAGADESVGLVGGVITYCSDPETVWWAGGRFNWVLDTTRNHDRKPTSAINEASPFETEWVSGCMMLIPRRVFSKVGFFDERYFIWSEEWDYSVRVAQAGYRLMVAPKARICHKIGKSLGVMKPLNYYYGIRNGLLFKRKHLPWKFWYPYFIIYLVNRVFRFTQLVLQGRSDLAKAGIEAVADFVRGKTGKWERQA